jgi:antitoxin component of MazEF toxin-antitoxin module
MATQIVRTGGSVTVEIPEELLHRANLSVGDPVEWTLTPTGSLALRSPRESDMTEVENGYAEWAQADVEAGLADIEAGRTVSGEAVANWLRSWGTEHELPPPV